MSEDYVQQETFEATMREIRALMKAAESDNRRIVEVMQADLRAHEARQEKAIAEIRGEVAELRGEVKAINGKVEGFADTFTVAINDLKDELTEIKTSLASRSPNLIGWLIGIAAIVIAGVQVYVAIFRG